MSVLFTDIIAGAKSLADYDGTNAGFQPPLGLDDARWSIWGNQSIESLYKKFLIWNPDLFESTAVPDYTLSNEEGQITPPADYRSFRGLTKSPDTNCARTVHKFNYGQRDDQCDVHYREAGKIIRLEPKHRSNGTYRLTYTAGPVNLSTGDSPAAGAATDATVKAMIDNSYLQSFPLFQVTPDTIQQSFGLSAVTAGVLPGNWTGSGSGPTRTLTATVNGATTVSGVLLAVPNPVLVLGGGGLAASDQGLYIVTSVGNGGSPTIMIRSSSYDQATEIAFGSSIFIAGGTNAGKAFAMNVPGTIVVDTTPLNFANIGAPTLLVDGVQVSAGDKLFINTDGNQKFDGLYDLSLFAGTVSAVWQFARSAGQTQGTTHPVGYTVAVTSGVSLGNRIYVANGNIIWSISPPTWSKAQSAIDPLYEPGREWLEVRTALRALGKGEESTGELGARLAELTAELQVYVQSLDSGDGDCAVDVEDHRPGIYRLLGH